MSVTGGADALSEVSRAFYENTRVKGTISLAWGGYCIMLLAW